MMCKNQHDVHTAWSVGIREGVVKDLLNDFKFVRKMAAHKDLAVLLNNCMPRLPRSAVLVPVPTVAAHIRKRGYDHCLLLAKSLAKMQKLKCNAALVKRHTDYEQRGLSRVERIAKAKQAFYASKKLDDAVLYVIVDDIVTTGATVDGVAHALKLAGAKHIGVAVIALQPSTPAIKSVKM